MRAKLAPGSAGSSLGMIEHLRQIRFTPPQPSHATRRGGSQCCQYSTGVIHLHHPIMMIPPETCVIA
ncbi:hypothetical protein, partial [Dyella sp.]|uniref:hypothetical protein n=1 Tax=Dyella sp. TaxID=1869338 RepID=UPI002D807381